MSEERERKENDFRLAFKDFEISHFEMIILTENFAYWKEKGISRFTSMHSCSETTTSFRVFKGTIRVHSIGDTFSNRATDQDSIG